MAKKAVSKEINFSFTLDETNTIIESLGHLPFMRVYRIIEKIHAQAQGQFNLNAVVPKKKAAKKRIAAKNVRKK